MHVKDKNVTRNSQHEFTKGKSHLAQLVAFCSDWPGRPGEFSVMCFVKRGKLAVSLEILYKECLDGLHSDWKTRIY